MSRLRTLVLLCTAACVTACEEDAPNISGVPGYGINTIRVAPSVDTIFVPDTVRVTDRATFTAHAFSKIGTDLGVLRYAWTTSDPTIATVDSFGVVTPQSYGTVQVIASAYKADTATLVILPATSVVVVTPAVDTVLVNDPAVPPRNQVQLHATAYDAAGKALTGVVFDWDASASAVTVDATGLASGQAVGTVTVTASSNGLTGSSTVVSLEAIASVSILPAPDTVFVEEPIATTRDTLRLTPQSRDPYGGLLSGVSYAWSSSAPGVATVDASGLVHAVGLGLATITVQAGSRSAQHQVRVAPVVASVSVHSPVSEALALDTIQLVATALNYAGAPMVRAFEWTSSNPAIATVSSQGAVNFLAAGTVQFTARTAFRSASVSVTAWPRRLVALDAGAEFTCGYTALGRGYCWGLETAGQTAAAADSICFPGGLGCTLLPKRMNMPALALAQVSAGGAFACGLSEDQQIYCWGSDDAGQIGNGLRGGGPDPSPATVKTERFTRLSAGASHACALNLVGTAYCWGDDTFGQLGDNRLVNSTTPVPVFDTTLAFTSISAGARHTCALASSGNAYCWGDGTQGQLGNGDAAGRMVPTPVSGGMSWIAISAGDNHTCGIEFTGAMYCWGDNTNGELGTGTPGGNSLVPVAATGPGAFSALSAGAHHTCGIANGMVMCWGSSDWGQVGDGDVSSHSVATPSMVAGLSQATLITAGASHTCAIDGGGLTWCWGSNRWGTLGNEYQAAVRATPQLVARPR